MGPSYMVPPRPAPIRAMTSESPITILDGPMGTQLESRCVSTAGRAWSARALLVAPDTIAQIHREYAAAGATVHTACTFRTTARAVGDGWEFLARSAVSLCRQSIPRGHRVAASIAPLEDCYSPWLSPPDPRPEHRRLAQVLAQAGCDLLLCETFPHVGEALVAVDEAVATGRETWLALTPGPRGDLLNPEALGFAAMQAARRGAAGVLVNCVGAIRALPYVQSLAAAGVPFGVYANAGEPTDGIGWGRGQDGPERYATLATRWINAGATIIGSCCGTEPAHIRALAERLA
jgi:S-methylmethionine-dependent homocysteine/selenocysteine methylase